MKIIQELLKNNTPLRNPLDVYNPADNALITSITTVNEEQIIEIINASCDYFPIWSKTTIQYRITLLEKLYQLILENIEDIAYIITLEQGKILSHAKNEVAYAASFVKWFTSVALNVQGKIKYPEKDYSIITTYEPVGVVAAITPWNFPFAMVTRKVVPAIITGCTVLLKPSEITPLSALYFAQLTRQAGIPDNVLNVVNGDANIVSKCLCNDFRVRNLSFTGSTIIGKKLYQEASKTLKRLTLELGGNAPFIVDASADIEQAASDLTILKIKSSGQSCTAPNRIFVHKSIYQKFIALLRKKFLSMKIGNGLNNDSDLGPLTTKNSINKISGLLQNAIEGGAKILCGGNFSGNFLYPTIVDNCNDKMQIFHKEIFGPVAALYEFEEVEEVVTKANNTEYGLQAYIYTRDSEQAEKISSELDFGVISINNAFGSNCRASFSGRKSSGFGIEGGDEGIFEFLQTKYINKKLFY